MLSIQFNNLLITKLANPPKPYTIVYGPKRIPLCESDFDILKTSLSKVKPIIEYNIKYFK